MVRIIMKNPDGVCCGRPEDIFIKRNGQSESFYRMLEEEGNCVQQQRQSLPAGSGKTQECLRRERRNFVGK